MVTTTIAQFTTGGVTYSIKDDKTKCQIFVDPAFVDADGLQVMPVGYECGNYYDRERAYQTIQNKKDDAWASKISPDKVGGFYQANLSSDRALTQNLITSGEKTSSAVNEGLNNLDSISKNLSGQVTTLKSDLKKQIDELMEIKGTLETEVGKQTGKLEGLQGDVDTLVEVQDRLLDEQNKLLNELDVLSGEIAHATDLMEKARDTSNETTDILGEVTNILNDATKTIKNITTSFDFIKTLQYAFIALAVLLVLTIIAGVVI